MSKRLKILKLVVWFVLYLALYSPMIYGSSGFDEWVGIQNVFAFYGMVTTILVSYYFANKITDWIFKDIG